jgi:hypothetical protein
MLTLAPASMLLEWEKASRAENAETPKGTKSPTVIPNPEMLKRG